MNKSNSVLNVIPKSCEVVQPNVTPVAKVKPQPVVILPRLPSDAVVKSGDNVASANPTNIVKENVQNSGNVLTSNENEEAKVETTTPKSPFTKIAVTQDIRNVSSLVRLGVFEARDESTKKRVSRKGF